MHDSTAAKIWADNSALATTLVLLGVDRFGFEALRWAPNTWVDEVYHESRVELSDGNLDRLMAGCRIMTYPDGFLTDECEFEFLCRMLSSEGAEARPKYGELACSVDCGWGLVEYNILEPAERKYAPAIVEYVRTALKYDGADRLPNSIRAVGIDAAPDVGNDDAEYNDDPEMFEAVKYSRNSAAHDVDAFVVERLHLLADQLDSLTLHNGSQKEFAAKLRKMAN